MQANHNTMRTDTVLIPVIDGDTTVELRAPWLRPPVTAVYRRPSAWEQVRRSAYADDVRSGLRRALAVLGGFGIAYFVLLLARGGYVAAALLGLVP